MHLDVTFRRRPHQRRLPAPRLLSRARRRRGSAARRTASTLPVRAAVISIVSPPGQRRVRIGAGIEKPLDDGGVAVGAGERQRRHAVAVRRAHIGAGREQPVHEIEIVVIRRPVQRRRAVRLRRVDVGALRRAAGEWRRDPIRCTAAASGAPSRPARQHDGAAAPSTTQPDQQRPTTTRQTSCRLLSLPGQPD